MTSAGKVISLIKAIGATKKDVHDEIQTQLPGEVSDWLGDHITNPDSPPLDRSLSSSSAAAPADLVGGLKSAINSIEYADGCPWIKELYINSDGKTFGIAKVGTLQTSEIDGVPSTRLRFFSADGQSYKGNTDWFPTSNPPFTPIAIKFGSNPAVTGGYVLADFTDPTISVPFNSAINEPGFHLDMSPTIKLYLEYGVLDATLSHAGQSADAKATGDKVAEIHQMINDIGLSFKEIIGDESDFTETNVVLHGGGTRSFTGWKATDYIPVAPGQKYDFSASAFNKTVSGKLYKIDAVAFFNASKEYVDGIYSESTTSGETMSGTFTVPSGIYYVKEMLYPAVTQNPVLNRLSTGAFETPMNAKVCFVGDSLTQGIYSGGGSDPFVFVSKPYPTIFKEMMIKRGFDITAKNFGRRGLAPVTYWQTAIPSDGAYHSPASGEPGDTIDFDDSVDCVIIMLGTNGHIEADTEADAKALIESATSGQTYPYTIPEEVLTPPNSWIRNVAAYCNIIEYIMNETSNHAQIILVAPIYACDSKKNKIIKTLNMMKALSERYQVPYINATFESGIGDFNKGVFYNQGDLLHLNQAGYHKFGTFIASKFVSLYSTFDMDELPSS